MTKVKQSTLSLKTVLCSWNGDSSSIAPVTQKQSTVERAQSFDDKVFHLCWNGNTKTIPISKAILHTAPGVSIVCSLEEAFHDWDPNLFCLKAQKSDPDYKVDLQVRNQESDDTPDIQKHKMECPDSTCDRCSYIKESSKKRS